MYIGRRWLSSQLDCQNAIATNHQWRQNYSTRRQLSRHVMLRLPATIRLSIESQTAVAWGSQRI